MSSRTSLNVSSPPQHRTAGEKHKRTEMEEVPESVRKRARESAEEFFASEGQESKQTIHLPKTMQSFEQMFIERGIPRFTEKLKVAFEQKDFHAVVGILNYIWHTISGPNFDSKREKSFDDALASILDPAIQAYRALTDQEKEQVKKSHPGGGEFLKFFEDICAPESVCKSARESAEEQESPRTIALPEMTDPLKKQFFDTYIPNLVERMEQSLEKVDFSKASGSFELQGVIGQLNFISNTAKERDCFGSHLNVALHPFATALVEKIKADTNQPNLTPFEALDSVAPLFKSLARSGDVVLEFLASILS